MRNGIRTFLLTVGLTMSGAVNASPYLQAVEDSEPAEETLAEAREQIEKHDVDIIDELPVRPFHKRPAAKMQTSDTLCAVCHDPLPHRASTRARSFLNMHARFIACEGCHYRPENAGLEFRWLGDREVNPSSGKARAENGGAFRAERAAGEQIGLTRDGESVIPGSGHPFLREVEQVWKGDALERKVLLKARLHGPLETNGPACTDCHGKRPNPLDLRALGATPEQVHAYEHNKIAELIGRGDDAPPIRLTDLLR